MPCLIAFAAWIPMAKSFSCFNISPWSDFRVIGRSGVDDDYR